METVFLELLNRSIAAGWLVLAVLALRLLFRKAPKSMRCILWALVGIRLLCPFHIESILSMIPSVETIPREILYAQNPVIESGFDTVNEAVNPILSSSLAPEAGASVNPVQIILYLASCVWMAGVCIMFLYAGGSYFRLLRQVKAAMRLEEGLWMGDEVRTPFVMGIFAPRIYLPSNLDNAQKNLVITHEKAHLKRHDHWWKPMGFLLLSVYWFHPLCWVAYVLCCRDIELACDERVISQMGGQDKKDYAHALLSCSIPRHMATACPLAFGEGSVKGRIQAVLNYKKPSFWLAVSAVAVCIVSAFCFLTDPLAGSEDIFGGTYSVEEIIYDAPPFGFTYHLDTAPDYCFTADYTLMERNGIMSGNVWTDMGVFRESGYASSDLAAFFVWGNEGFLKGWSPESFKSAEEVWRIDVGDETEMFYLVMQMDDGQVFIAVGYGSEDGDYIRWLWRLERQSGFYDREYLDAQIESMCGRRVRSFALYERDWNPGYLLVGFLTQEQGVKKGFALFRYDSATKGYVMVGYKIQADADLGAFTIGEDWGLDHSVTIVLSSRLDLVYVTAEAEGEMLGENNAHGLAPVMVVFEWPKLLAEETAVEVRYYNTRDEEIGY